MLAAHIALVVHVLCHTAEIVAGDGALAAVLVEGAHFHIGDAAALHEHYAVAAYAVVGTAEADAEGLGAADAAVEILDEDIVVAAALHLGELYTPPPEPHGVNVHQLRVLLSEAAGDDVRQGHGRVQGGEAGYAQLHGPPVQGDIVLKYSMDSTIFFESLNVYKCNPAISIASDVGTSVAAAASGIVQSVEVNEETGTTLTVAIGDGYETTYGLLDEVTVKAGDSIAAGQYLGTVASPTAYYVKEGSNLYFKLTKDGVPVDPMGFFE